MADVNAGNLADFQRRATDQRLEPEKLVEVKLVSEKKLSINGINWIFPKGMFTKIPQSVADHLNVMFGPPDPGEFNEIREVSVSPVGPSASLPADLGPAPAEAGGEPVKVDETK